MAQFDSTLKRETWVFQQIGKDERGRPITKRLPFNWVEYDGEAARYLEPVSEGFQAATHNNNTLVPVPGTNAGVCVGVEIIEGNPFPAFALGMNVGF
jgi:hypothetical protein